MKPILLIWCILIGSYSLAQPENVPDEIEARQLPGGKYQLVYSSNGNAVNKHKWDSIQGPANDFYLAWSAGEVAYLDNKGAPLSRKRYSAARHFHDGLAAVSMKGQWGFIDREGKEILSPQFELAGDYIEGTITVKEHGAWKIIDAAGNLVKMLPRDYAGDQQTVTVPAAPPVSAFLKSAAPQSAQKTTAAMPCPPNLDFESGNLSNWSSYTGNVTAAGTTNQVSVSLSSPLNNRHNVYATATTAVDPFGLFPINPANGSGNAVKLGNSQVGAEAERIRYVINVPYPANEYSITFQYAVVFENPDAGSGQAPHADHEQPRFTAKMYDPVTNEYISCASFNFVSSLVPGFLNSGVPSTSPNPAPVKYKPWSSVYVNLSKYAGKTLYLDFTTADCTQGGHFGYAYVDVLDCGVTGQVQYNCLAPNVTTLRAPPGFQGYRWYNSSFSSLLGTGQNLTLSPGPALGTEYWAVLQPYNNTDCGTCNCTDTVKVTVTPSYPLSDAGPDVNTCAGTAVTIGAAARPNLSYVWTPATGLANPTAATTTANPAVTTRYYLTTTDNSTGCSAVDTVDVTVSSKPAVNFTVNQNSQCVNQNSFVFNNTTSSTNGTPVYQWNFGDSSSSVITSPSHTYGGIGTYTVKLYATNPNGCIDSASRQVTVMPAPTANYNINNPNQCHAGNSYQFTSTTPGMNNYYWDIGGFNSIQTNPQYSFPQPGIYMVKLLVTAANGCKDSITRQVNVYPQPTANFSVNNSSQCINGNNFIFNNTSSVSNGSMNYNWTMGDNTGTSSTISPVYTYFIPGDYVVRLITTTNSGCVDSIKRTVSVKRNPVMDFTVNFGSQCLPGNDFIFTNNSFLPFGSISFEWDFGDGTYSNQTNPNHSYVTPGSYTVTVTGTSNNGCQGSLTRPLSVFAIPQVSISPSSSSFCQGDTTRLIASASAGSGSILRYSWFRDGIPVPVFGVTSELPVTQTGTYDLVVINTNGCTNRSNPASILVHPLPTGSILPPVSTTICEGSGVLLEATPGSNYQWFYNGSAITSAVTNSIMATTPGTYSVRLTNEFNCTSWATNTMVLNYVNKPSADFLYSERCTNIPLRFNNISNVSTSGPINWSWDFGNGTNSTVFNPEPVFTHPGIYPIKLKVGSTICSWLADSITKYISIVAPPVGIRYATVNTVLGTPHQLQARDFGVNYSWRPPVGLSNANISNPVFSHDNDMEYQVRIRQATGCQVTDTVLVRVHKEGEVFVPRAWSPNNDGRNDYLYPIMVGMMELKLFRVYNRWGQLMFETTQPRQGWNGIASGQPQAIDTYTWTVEAVYPDGKILKRTGNSILMR